MIKDVLVNLSPTVAGEYPALDYAISMAAAFEAHVTGLAFAFEPVITPDPIAGMPPDMIEAWRQEAINAARAGAERVAAAAAKAGVSGDAKVLDTTFGGAAEHFGRMARAFDIAVVAQAEPRSGGNEQSMIEAALFHSGRPVIVVPHAHRAPLALERVLVCWDGGRPATRALNDALPFLARAKAIEVVTAVDRDDAEELPPSAADIASHLGRHNLKAGARRLVAAGTDVPTALLAHADETGAGLVVMGGFGHSRLRQFVLGGVTRSTLADMKVPALMSH